MFPYLLLLLIPSMFALFNTRRLSPMAWYATFVVYVVFVGLRDEVGADWVQYGFIHTALASYPLSDILSQSEPLSYLLFWVSENAGLHVYLSNTIAAIIMMTGVFAFARRTVNPWLAVVAATPYFIIVMGMSGVRQAMAAGVILFLFSRWERYSFIKRGLYILMAAMFHTSALVNNIFLIIKLKIPLRYKIALGTVMMALTLYLSLEVSIYADNIEQYQQRYLEGAFINQSYGSLFHIAIITIPAVLGFINRKRIRDNIHNLSLLHFGLYASLCILLLNFYSSTAASRLTIYLYFVPMMIYPALAASSGARARQGMVFAAILFNILILAGWFQLGFVSFTYIPYKNVLFDD